VTEPLLALAADLERRGEAFALATVVRCEAPTSAKPGAKALIREDGTVEGWVGGACAEPVVVREALNALRDGRARLIGLYGEGGRGPGRAAGILDYAMTCHSGGTLEIYVEPYLPSPLLVLVGHGPVVETLATPVRVTLRIARETAGLTGRGLVGAARAAEDLLPFGGTSEEEPEPRPSGPTAERPSPVRPVEPRPPTRERPPEPVHVDEEATLVGEFAERGAEEGAGAELDLAEPWEGYDGLSVEQVLARLDGVAESAVIGVPEPRLGEVGKAFVVARPGFALAEADVLAFCRERLANYKVPRRVEFRDALPRNPSGKVLKRVLKEEA